MAPTTATPPAAPGSSGVMSLYWELASVDPEVRQQAAESLLRALYTFQQQHDAAKNGSAVATATTTATEDNLDVFCAQDVSYGIKRLLRGLPSSRDGARQGFAVALTELLRGLEFLDVSVVLSMLTKLTQTEGAKGQEEREILFGRIFGLMAICQAGMLSRASTTVEDVKSMITSLLKYASSKSYLKEICFRVLLTIMDNVKGTLLEHEVLASIIPTVLDKEIETPEDLWFGIVMQTRYPDFEWATVLPSWKHAQVLHRKNQTQLVEILKQSTYASPRIHSVWDALFDILLSSEIPKHSITLRTLWSSLDEALYSSTHERKYLGMQLFQRVLTRVEAADVPFIFTPQLLRTLINNLAKHDNYLYKIAKQTATVLSKLAQDRKDIALQLVLQLVGKNGHQRFDVITRTKTVETILGAMEGDDILTYVQYLETLFLDASTAAETTVESQRHWVLDQMTSLLKNGRIPKQEKWVQSVAKFVCLHAFYDVKKADAKSDLLKPPQPPVSDATRAVCKERFFALLGTLAAMILKDEAGKPLHAGLMQNGQLWVRDIYSFMVELSANENVTAADELDEIATEAIKKASKVVTQMHEETAKLDAVQNRDVLAQYRAFELLFLHVLLQVYTEPTEAIDVLDELENCYNLFFKEKSQKDNKKRKASDDDSDDEDHEPIEVLVDVLISFLAKPSALLRTLSQEVFKVFCNQLTKKALDLIFEVLSTKGGVAGAQELFENEDDEDAMDIDEGPMPEGADDDEQDDDEEDDEDDEEEDEGDDANAEVDEELRLKIKEAMGNAAAGDDDSEEEEFMDDDEMGVFDDKLAEIFRQRKDIKTAKKDLKQQVLHFKFRVVDLLDVFLRKAPQSPLVIEMIMPLLNLLTTTARTADEQDLHVRLEALVKNKLFKIKDVPNEPALDADRAVEILKEVHDYARKASDGSTVALCSGASLLLVRILSHCAEPVVAEAKTPKKSPKKRKVNAEAQAAEKKPLSRVAAIYLMSLTDFMTPNKTRVKPILFLDLVTRYPNYVWELLGDVVSLASSATIKPYPLVQSHNVIVRLIQQMPKNDEEAKKPIIQAVWPPFIANVVKVLNASAASEKAETEGCALNKERVKELVKDLLALARRVSKVVGNEEMPDLWKSNDLQSALDAVCGSDKFTSLPSLSKQSKELMKIVNNGTNPVAAESS
ncbi:hypothetical protein PhCBS80983_g02349 [Powellomyces hirtus]|uniref:DNA polymerase V n=1 Tax=Powellomyces hirtus TaxID=109895 RepID=A0A507E6X7_9FUNG|nr:hypothetical protein PhCBS80983_g02349 [Powellomyces hirtus]